MARPKPNPELVKPAILTSAKRLIQSQGFDLLTMKNLARECNMSVGKLYHFFPSKDALFLELEIDYFEALHALMETAAGAVSLDDAKQGSGAHRVRLEAVSEQYIDFAISHFALYQLVTHPPKVYSQFVGTEAEALAHLELRSALKSIIYVRDVFRQAFVSQCENIDEHDLQRYFLLFANSMHGLIVMSQSAAWPYIAAPPAQVEQGKVGVNKKRALISEQLALLLSTLLSSNRE